MRWLAPLCVVLSLSAPAAAQQPSSEEARVHYLEGKAHFEHGRFTDAIVAFELSYELSRAPGLLFNLAQAHRLSGPEHCARAGALYQRYLDASQRAENEREVRERLAEMEACVARQRGARLEASPAGPAAPARPGPAQLRPPSKTAPVLTIGVGAALLVAGAVLYGSARQKYAEAEQECPCYPGRYSSWETATLVAYGLVATGGVTAATGVTWWLTLGPPSAKTAPQQAILGIRGNF